MFWGNGICRWEVCLQYVQADGAISISLYVLKAQHESQFLNHIYLRLCRCSAHLTPACSVTVKNVTCSSKTFDVLVNCFPNVQDPYSPYDMHTATKCLMLFLLSSRIFCDQPMGVRVHKNLIKLMEVTGSNCLCGCKIKVYK